MTRGHSTMGMIEAQQDKAAATVRDQRHVELAAKAVTRLEELQLMGYTEKARKEADDVITGVLPAAATVPTPAAGTTPPLRRWPAPAGAPLRSRRPSAFG